VRWPSPRGLIGELGLNSAHYRRVVEDGLRNALPERMADTAARFDGIANRRTRYAGRMAVEAVRVRRRAGRLATADDRGDRAPVADRADTPQGVEVRPRSRPLPEEQVTEPALDTDRGVARASFLLAMTSFQSVPTVQS